MAWGRCRGASRFNVRLALAAGVLSSCGGRAELADEEVYPRLPDVALAPGSSSGIPTPSASSGTAPAGSTAPTALPPLVPPVQMQGMRPLPATMPPTPATTPPPVTTTPPATTTAPTTTTPPAQTTPVPDPEPTRCWGIDTGITTYVTGQEALEALEGCEELFGLQAYGAPLDLRPLTSLRRVGAGGLYLEGVVALDGLENLETVEALSVAGPSIRSLQPLASLRSVHGLLIRDTSLLDLSGLENVAGLTDISIDENPLLENLTGLRVEDSLNFVSISNNAVLSDMTSLARVRAVSWFTLMNNPLLILPGFNDLAVLGRITLSNTTARAAIPEFPLLTSIDSVDVQDNGTLERFAFPALQTVGYMTVTGNPNLTSVSLPQLQQAASVLIMNNALLDGVALASSLSNVSCPLLRVAPDQTQYLLDPCPWATDEICDEYTACAYNTDPVCH